MRKFLQMNAEGDVFVVTLDGDRPRTRERVGHADTLTLDDLPDGVEVLDAAGQSDEALIHAEAVAWNRGSARVARALRAVIDARLARDPGRHHRLKGGPLPVHLEIGRRLDERGEE